MWIGSIYHYLQGFIHPRWCRISSINSTILLWFMTTDPKTKWASELIPPITKNLHIYPPVNHPIAVAQISQKSFFNRKYSSQTPPSHTGNSGNKEGKCFLVGSFFWAQVSQVGCFCRQVFFPVGKNLRVSQGFCCCRQVELFSGCKTENPRLYDDHQATSF